MSSPTSSDRFIEDILFNNPDFMTDINSPGFFDDAPFFLDEDIERDAATIIATPMLQTLPNFLERSSRTADEASADHADGVFNKQPQQSRGFEDLFSPASAAFSDIDRFLQNMQNQQQENSPIVPTVPSPTAIEDAFGDDSATSAEMISSICSPSSAAASMADPCFCRVSVHSYSLTKEAEKKYFDGRWLELVPRFLDDVKGLNAHLKALHHTKECMTKVSKARRRYKNVINTRNKRNRDREERAAAGRVRGQSAPMQQDSQQLREYDDTDLSLAQQLMFPYDEMNHDVDDSDDEETHDFQ